MVVRLVSTYLTQEMGGKLVQQMQLSESDLKPASYEIDYFQHTINQPQHNDQENVARNGPPAKVR